MGGFYFWKHEGILFGEFPIPMHLVSERERFFGIFSQNIGKFVKRFDRILWGFAAKM